MINKCLSSWVLSLLLLLKVELTSVYFMLCVYTQKVSFWFIFRDFPIHQKKFRVNLYRPPNWKIMFTYVLDPYFIWVSIRIQFKFQEKLVVNVYFYVIISSQNVPECLYFHQYWPIAQMSFWSPSDKDDNGLLISSCS